MAIESARCIVCSPLRSLNFVLASAVDRNGYASKAAKPRAAAGQQLAVRESRPGRRFTARKDKLTSSRSSDQNTFVVCIDSLRRRAVLFFNLLGAPAAAHFVVDESSSTWVAPHTRLVCLQCSDNLVDPYK
jgi:hypothetical protein